MTVRIEWSITEIELTSQPGRDDVVSIVSWECSGQRDNGDGTWTEISKTRRSVDVPYDPNAAFGDYRGMSQADILAAWVFPTIDAPAIEALVTERALKRTVQLPDRLQEMARRDAEWQLASGVDLTDEQRAAFEGTIAANAVAPTVTPSPVADSKGRDAVARMPPSLR